MRRWYFISGLTVILVLLLTLGGFSIWTLRVLTNEIQLQISTDYDSIRALRELRTANTHINAAFLTEKSSQGFGNQARTYEHERGVILRNLDRVAELADEPGELQLVARLDALVHDYLSGFERLLSNPPRRTEDLSEQQALLGGKASAIADVVEEIVRIDEAAMFARRDRAIDRGRRSNLIALGLVFVSLGIYGFTSLRLTQGVFQPLARLRDSITGLREKKFADFVPVESTDELGQIAVAFNGMATELRAYIAEQDERVITANRLSRAILEALPKPVYIVNLDFGVTMVNPRAVRLSEALGVPGGLPSIVRRCVDEAAAKGEDIIHDDLRQAIEVAWESAEGQTERRYFLPQVFRMKSAIGAPEGWAVLLVDVTNLRRLDEAKTKAISTLGHEVKTPVTGIRMTLHLLLEERLGPLTPDQRELIQSGRDDCERLLAVLQALLELARFESGRSGINLEPVAVTSLLDQTEAMHGSAVRFAGRELKVEPFDESTLKVKADLIHASRVLGNFLSNAAKYSDPGTAVVLRAGQRADGYVRFSVINRAERAFTEAEQAKVFEPFYRRSGESQEGAGLGLTIAREIAVLHGGRVGVWSQGGLVEFFFDLREATQTPIPTHASGDAAAPTLKR